MIGASCTDERSGASGVCADLPRTYWEFHENGFHQAVRAGRWKGVRHGLKGPLEVYDLEADLAEAHDRAAERPEIAAQLRAVLDQARTADPEWPSK